MPHLLQRTGKAEEAHRAFERLLEKGYPDQLDNPTIQWKERGLIYDAMRRALGREGRAAEAALYEGLFYLADAYGRFLDAHRSDHDPRLHRFSRTRVEAVAEDMRTPLSEGPPPREVAELLYSAVERFGAVEADALFREVEEGLRELFGVASR